MKHLSQASIAEAAAGTRRPGYDRSKVTAGIVHLGIGAFHRGHQAVFVDDALERGHLDWGIIAASLRSPAARDALAPQDCLYTVAFRNGAATECRIIGSILDIIVAPEEPERLIAALCDPSIRLVTLTITEKGYGMDPATRRLDHDDAAIKADLADPGHPTTALGFLAFGIARRRLKDLAPFTLLSCDNLSHNGQVLKAMLVEFAAVSDPDLALYIEKSVPFASSMVDRIVPATTEQDRDQIAALTGLIDAAPVVAEPAFSWIIEGEFPDGRPPFGPSGVLFVDDLDPFEQMKLRLLNGAHTAIAAIGRLAGFETVPEAVSDKRVQAFLEAYWQEMLPTVPIDAKLAQDYKNGLLARFANSALPHKTAQIASDASQKVPQRLLPALREALEAGRETPALVFAIAVWMRSCGGINDRGLAFSINDPMLERWAGRPDQAGLDAGRIITAFRTYRGVLGDDLSDNEVFLSALAAVMADILQHGVLGAIELRFS